MMMDWIGWIVLVGFGGFCLFGFGGLLYMQMWVNVFGGKDLIWPRSLFFLAGCIACWFLAYTNAPFTIEVK